jgi:aspartyl-tRNA(Asn)/glutamyl-tRNA(Gln) amidotransferase subunit C
MNTQKTFSSQDVKHIAKLAKIPVTAEEEKKLAHGFNSVIKVIEQLNNVDIKNVEPTHQVTGMANIMREDVVDEKRMFSQEEALMNTKNKYNGYFVVNRVLDD